MNKVLRKRSTHDGADREEDSQAGKSSGRTDAERGFRTEWLKPEELTFQCQMCDAFFRRESSEFDWCVRYSGNSRYRISDIGLYFNGCLLCRDSLDWRSL